MVKFIKRYEDYNSFAAQQKLRKNKAESITVDNDVFLFSESWIDDDDGSIIHYGYECQETSGGEYGWAETLTGYPTFGTECKVWYGDAEDPVVKTVSDASYSAGTSYVKEIKPGVVLVNENNNVFYNRKPRYMEITYNVPDATYPVDLWCFKNSYSNVFFNIYDIAEEVLIDNVPVNFEIAEEGGPISSGQFTVRYKFETTGLHTVKFDLNTTDFSEIDLGSGQKGLFCGLFMMNPNFSEYYNLIVSAKIPEGITNIPESFFESCTILSSVTLPKSLVSISGHAFMYCSSLQTITIPEKLNSIGELAFGFASQSQSGLTSITSYAKNAPEIVAGDTSTFKYIKQNGTLYYPAGSDYSSWLDTDETKKVLGYYGWTGVEI